MDQQSEPKADERELFDHEGRQVVAVEGENTALAGTTPKPSTEVAAANQNVPYYMFPLRGNHLNPIIDVSSSLISLVLRCNTLHKHDQIIDLHKQIRNEIEATELELHKLGYDRVTILAHRYCICSFIDEAIMNSHWGQNSEWLERSLLAMFHNETWGGEKFFVILDRLMAEPQRYLHLIEFLYLCMTLGFEGKYRVRHNGKTELEEIIAEVHEVIRKERGEAPEELVSTKEFLQEKKHFISRHTPVSRIWIGAAVIALGIYAYFYMKTNNHSTEVIQQLQTLLGN